MFPIPILARSCAVLGIIAGSACTGLAAKPPPVQAFYTVTAEIALSRHAPRVAALQYAAIAEHDRDTGLLRRATDVTAECLQPSLTAAVAARWIEVDPAAVDAHRAAAKAALKLHRIEQSAEQYRMLLTSSPRGTDAEFAVIETELASADNFYGARQVADRLVTYFPASVPALRLQGFAALRADDPAAAAHALQAALAAPVPPLTAAGDPAGADASRREMLQGLWRARVLAGDPEEPLALAKAAVEHEQTAESRFQYALLLLAAQQTSAARAQLAALALEPESQPVALRLLGLLDFQDDQLAEADARFAELLATGKFPDDALYYLGQIAERHADPERALRLYAQVQSGDNAVAALLRAAVILRTRGAAPAADELLDRLVDEEPQRAPQILIARARMAADAGDAAQAVDVLREAIQQYPDSVELRYAMASVSEAQGNLAVALRVLKEVAALRPADPAALNAYGYTLADHHRRLKLARRLIERAYAGAPKNAAILDSLGWVLFRQGHGEQALPYLNSAFADERDADVGAHLGEVLWRLNRRADAERIWADASRMDSDNHLLKATQLRLHASS